MITAGTSPRLGFAAWCGAAGLSYAGQHSLSSGEIERGSWFFVGAILLAIAAAYSLADPQGLAPEVEGTEPLRKHSRRTGALVLLAIVLDAAACLLVAEQMHYHVAAALWLAALASAVLAAAVWDGARAASRSRNGTRLVEIVTVAAILVVAVALRLTQLTTLPPEVHGDEAACGIAARRILCGEAPNLFDVGWSNLSNVGFAISAASMAVFGDDLFGLRMASVFLGTASVLLTYLLGRQLFSPRVGALAAFLFAVGHWPIHSSRSGIDYMQATFAVALLFFCFLRGLTRRSVLDQLLAGFAAGLCISVYYSARIGPVLVAVFALHRIVLEPGFLRRHRLGLAALAFGAALFLAPQVPVYVRAPIAFVARTNAVWVFSPNNLQHEMSSYGVSSLLGVLRIQVKYSLQAFNLRGESSLQYGPQRPILDFWTGPLFVLGMAMATARPLSPPCFLLASWFWLTLLVGSVLTTDALFSPRVVALMPALFIAAAVGLDSGWRGAQQALGRVAGYGLHVLAALLLVLAFTSNVHEYFVMYPTLRPATLATVLSAHIGPLNDQYRVYFLSRASMSLHYDTVDFLVPKLDGEDVGDGPLSLPLETPPATKGALFIGELGAPDAGARVAAIREAYPRARERFVTAANGYPLCYSLLVERSDLVAAAATRRGGAR